MSAGRNVPGRILTVEKRGRSPDGNPSWVLVFEVEASRDVILCRTAPDAQIGYELSERWAGRRCTLTYRVTERGTIVEDVREVAP